MGICKDCGIQTTKSSGFTDYCINCSRKTIMELPDEEIADRLTTEIYTHKEHAYLYEAVRRILLRTKKLNKNDEIKIMTMTIVE